MAVPNQGAAQEAGRYSRCVSEHLFSWLTWLSRGQLFWDHSVFLAHNVAHKQDKPRLRSLCSNGSLYINPMGTSAHFQNKRYRKKIVPVLIVLI